MLIIIIRKGRCYGLVIKSMTGFGRGEYLDEKYRFIVEIKAVNHRFNEIVIRMPKLLNCLEDKIRGMVAGTLLRGRIDIFITMDEYGAKKRVVRVDKELAIAYYNALRELAECISAPGGYANIDRLAQYPDVLKVEDVAENLAELWHKLQEAIKFALTKHSEMRETEGQAILQDFGKRLDKIETLVKEVEARAPQVLEEYKNRLLGRTKEALLQVNAEPEEARLLQEAVFFADRTNITEELVRLSSHIAQFRKALDIAGAVGRKLDFIVQEINRETNTIASKANDFIIANVVVEIKSEVEKVREQIQNIE